MNRAKAIVGWNADLVNGRDFRVEDHLDDRGGAIVWLTDELPAPSLADLEAGWANWLARRPSTDADPLTLLAHQIEKILRTINLPPDKAFQSLVEARRVESPATPKEMGQE